jgi:23S rRNA (cytosine1962-C5)-methyltransferase
MQRYKLKATKKYEQKFLNGYPLIAKESLENINTLKDEGAIIDIIDNKNHFIARAYYGRQNKGYGWVLTQNKKEQIDLNFFKQKIKSAIDYRANFYKSKDTNAFRVFNGEGDGVGGLSIDYFNGYYLITWYSIGIYKFKDTILNALKSLVEFKGIYQKKRFDSKGQYLEDSSDFLLGQEAPEPLIVKENGVNLAIYLDDGAMVGVFLDQKNVRKKIRDKYAKGKDILNTFSYTGAFSVYAALGGAKSTTSVDLAKRSLAKTKEQFEINNLSLKSNKIVVEDVFDYFKYAFKKGLKYDMVIADPPSFARSKKRTFSAKKDYTSLLKDIIKITNKSGVIVASTNAANFNMKTFKSFVEKAFKAESRKYKILESYSLPKDFRVSKNFIEGNYLKVLFIKIID